MEDKDVQIIVQTQDREGQKVNYRKTPQQQAITNPLEAVSLNGSLLVPSFPLKQQQQQTSSSSSQKSTNIQQFWSNQLYAGNRQQQSRTPSQSNHQPFFPGELQQQQQQQYTSLQPNPRGNGGQPSSGKGGFFLPNANNKSSLTNNNNNMNRSKDNTFYSSGDNLEESFSYLNQQIMPKQMKLPNTTYQEEAYEDANQNRFAWAAPRDDRLRGLTDNNSSNHNNLAASKIAKEAEYAQPGQRNMFKAHQQQQQQQFLNLPREEMKENIIPMYPVKDRSSYMDQQLQQTRQLSTKAHLGNSYKKNSNTQQIYSSLSMDMQQDQEGIYNHRQGGSSNDEQEQVENGQDNAAMIDQNTFEDQEEFAEWEENDQNKQQIGAGEEFYESMEDQSQQPLNSYSQGYEQIQLQSQFNPPSLASSYLLSTPNQHTPSQKQQKLKMQNNFIQSYSPLQHLQQPPPPSQQATTRHLQNRSPIHYSQQQMANSNNDRPRTTNLNLEQQYFFQQQLQQQQPQPYNQLDYQQRYLPQVEWQQKMNGQAIHRKDIQMNQPGKVETSNQFRTPKILPLNNNINDQTVQFFTQRGVLQQQQADHLSGFDGTEADNDGPNNPQNIPFGLGQQMHPQMHGRLSTPVSEVTSKRHSQGQKDISNNAEEEEDFLFNQHFSSKPSPIVRSNPNQNSNNKQNNNLEQIGGYTSVPASRDNHFFRNNNQHSQMPQTVRSLNSVSPNERSYSMVRQHNNSNERNSLEPSTYTQRQFKQPQQQMPFQHTFSQGITKQLSHELPLSADSLPTHSYSHPLPLFPSQTVEPSQAIDPSSLRNTLTLKPSVSLSSSKPLKSPKVDTNNTRFTPSKTPPSPVPKSPADKSTSQALQKQLLETLDLVRQLRDELKSKSEELTDYKQGLMASVQKCKHLSKQLESTSQVKQLDFLRASLDKEKATNRALKESNNSLKRKFLKFLHLIQDRCIEDNEHIQEFELESRQLHLQNEYFREMLQLSTLNDTHAATVSTALEEQETQLQRDQPHPDPDESLAVIRAKRFAERIRCEDDDETLSEAGQHPESYLAQLMAIQRERDQKQLLDENVANACLYGLLIHPHNSHNSDMLDLYEDKNIEQNINQQHITQDDSVQTDSITTSTTTTATTATPTVTTQEPTPVIGTIISDQQNASVVQIPSSSVLSQQSNQPQIKQTQHQPQIQAAPKSLISNISIFSSASAFSSPPPLISSSSLLAGENISTTHSNQQAVIPESSQVAIQVAQGPSLPKIQLRGNKSLFSSITAISSSSSSSQSSSSRNSSTSPNRPQQPSSSDKTSTITPVKQSPLPNKENNTELVTNHHKSPIIPHFTKAVINADSNVDDDTPILLAPKTDSQSRTSSSSSSSFSSNQASEMQPKQDNSQEIGSAKPKSNFSNNDDYFENLLEATTTYTTIEQPQQQLIQQSGMIENYRLIHHQLPSSATQNQQKANQNQNSEAISFKIPSNMKSLK